MIRFDLAAFLGAALLGLSAHPAAQGGFQLLTWDSSQWVPFSVHQGDQPVNDWWFYSYEKDGTHDAGDMTQMTWHAGSPVLACDGVQLPECWLGPESAGSWCCYIAEHVAGPPEREQSSSAFASVRAWDAPFSGTVMITTPNGNVRKTLHSLGGDGSWIRIYRNDLLFFERHLARGDTTGFAINESIDVNAGDRLWFHNDPGADTQDDEVVFLPFLTLSAGGGYDPSDVVRQSVADFTSDYSQGANGWTYEAYERTTDTYSQMTVTGTDGFGRFWQHGTVCKIWADRQHPSTTHDAARVWTAPQDGFLLVESLSSLEKLATGDPVHVQLRHIHQGGVAILWEETLTDVQDAELGVIANVRTGDRVAFHAQALAPSSTTSLVGLDVELRLYPGGEFPRTFVDHGGAGDVTISGDQHWFYEDHEITGNLVLQSGRLAVSQGSVALMNSYEGQFDYQFFGGELVTQHVTIGGGNTTGSPLHSNFEFYHPGEGRWRSSDTTVQYCYGTLLNDPTDSSILVGTRHLSGQQADLVHMGPGALVTLTDSEFNMRLQFPANAGGSFGVDLPVGVPITQTLDASVIPGVTWSADLVDTVVPNWDLAPYNMQVPNGSNTLTVTLDDVERLWAEVSGRNLVGTVIPFTGTFTSTPSVPPVPEERSFLDTFNVRWQAGSVPTDIQLWAYYLDGPSTAVTITPAGGPAMIAELFVFDGARAAYVGATGQYDAKCAATVIRCFDPGSRLVLKNCELGTTYTKGSIRAENGAYIKIDGATLAADVALQAVGGSVIEVLNLDPASVGAFDCCVDATSTISGLPSACGTCPP